MLPTLQTRRNLGYVDAKAQTLRVLIIRRALSMRVQARYSKLGPLIRTRAR